MPGGQAAEAASWRVGSPCTEVVVRRSELAVRNETSRQREPKPAAARATILVIAGPAESGRQLASALGHRGYATTIENTVREGIKRIVREVPDLVVVVLPLPDVDGRTAVERIKAADRAVSFVVAGVDDEIMGAAQAFELGAQDYVALPLADPADFLGAIGLLLGSRRGDDHLRYLRAKEAPASGWCNVVGQSPAIQRVLEVFRRVASRTVVGSTPTILLSGETGTGKGFLAKTFHYNGVRRNRPFVEVNCAAIPPSLIESELFGHERGSFTDAKAARSGLFETADRGTLFLDEIASISHDLQAKLLTAIEEKNVRRVGGRHPTRVDVQIIAATHEDLARRVKDGSFREDLFHRLNVVAVTMPPLRERGTDVILMAEAFLATLCHEYGQPVRVLSDDAKEWIAAYSWPGNVRELRNQIERIVLLENEDVVRSEHFRSEDAARVRVADSPTGRRVRITLPPDGMPLEMLEKEILRTALARVDGNVSAAARFLSVSRQTLMYRMKKHGLGESVEE
ncbi:MAG TPA: sigma-54 dependent transcriptional regulator [Kofleriaceae bacterium]